MTAVSLLVASHSSYPKIGEKPGEQDLRRALEKFDKNEIREDDLERVIVKVIRETVQEQERGGADIVTDGQIRWADPVSYWLQGFKGVKGDRLLRFFDTNCYFRVPKIEKPLEKKESFLGRDLITAIQSSERPVKAVLTGPVTLAFLAEKGVGQFEMLVEELSSLMAEEVQGLAEAGASWIQIEEPVVIRETRFFHLLPTVLRTISGKKGKAKLILSTYFADAAPLYGKFQDLPVDALGFDCVYGPGLLEKIASEGSDKILSLGVVDGRSTRLERVEDLVKRLKRVLPSLKGGETHLTSSCGLEYLPRAKAFKKLALLKRLKESLS